MLAQHMIEDEIVAQVVADRRHLHAHPELGFQEYETSAFVAARLRDLGLEVRTGIAGTGVVALLHGAAPGKTILLRADMDALPMAELNEVEYRSTVENVMHACGHDGHTAVLLGAARILSARRDRLAGTVKFIFQPCEEAPPGGAVAMIAEGVLDDPAVDAAFGLHLSQWTPIGDVAVRPGPTMAAADTFRLDIKGVGGHAASPHRAVDAALVAAQVLVALHALVAREVDPIQPAVVTVGMIHAGSASNIIPETAVLRGTVRTFDKDLREYLARRVEEVAVGVAAAMRAECVCTYDLGYPAVVNDPDSAALVAAVARDVVGEDHVTAGEPTMGGEDFASFLERVPGCFFFVGTRNEERGLTWAHHHPRFDIDEDGLPIAVAMFVALTERCLAPAS